MGMAYSKEQRSSLGQTLENLLVDWQVSNNETVIAKSKFDQALSDQRLLEEVIEKTVCEALAMEDPPTEQEAGFSVLVGNVEIAVGPSDERPSIKVRHIPQLKDRGK